LRESVNLFEAGPILESAPTEQQELDRVIKKIAQEFQFLFSQA